MLIGRVNSTAGNPDFYVDQLRQADVYNFIYDDLMPAALDDVNFGSDDGEGIIDISTLKPHVLNVGKETLPPEWVQEQVESVIYSVMPYFLGDVESFEVTITLRDRVEAAFQAFRNELHREGVLETLYDQLLESLIDEARANLEQMPDAFAL